MSYEQITVELVSPGDWELGQPQIVLGTVVCMCSIESSARSAVITIITCFCHETLLEKGVVFLRRVLSSWPGLRDVFWPVFT